MSAVVAEYLETIYNVAMEGDPVIAARLAQKFKVSPPNVAGILQRIAVTTPLAVLAAMAARLVRAPAAGPAPAG